MRILTDFQAFEGKLQAVDRKIDKEIEKTAKIKAISQENASNFADYTSFSCVSENLFNKTEKNTKENDNFQGNNTFQICNYEENLDYERFKTSLDNINYQENAYFLSIFLQFY